MNNTLLKKILDKLSFEDLYNEVKKDDKVIVALAMALVQRRRALFCRLIRSFIDEAIKEKNDELLDFLKTELVNADGRDNFSINTAVKTTASQQTTTRRTSVSDDPCSRGGGRITSC